MGEDVARAGLEGRHGVLRQGRTSSTRWRRSASTSSATAARPASATPARCRRRSPTSSTPRTSRSCRVLSRQPQLRGPHQPRREDELPRVAAAGGGVRAGGDDGHRPARRAARPGRTTARTSTSRTSGPPRRRSRASSRRPCTRRCSAPPTTSVFEGDERWKGARDPRGRPLRLGRALDLRAPALVPRGRPEGAGRARGHRGRARARQARRLASPPTTSRPRARSRRARPAALYLNEHGVEQKRLQLLRLAPRQPRGDGARHVRQHPPAQPARAGHRGRLHAPHARRRGDDDLRRVDQVRRGRACR